MFEALLSNRTVSVLVEALPRILTAGLTMTIPLTLVSFFFAMIIAVVVALVQYANVPVLRQIDSFIGFFVGILQCILFLLVAVTVLNWAVSSMDPTPAAFSRETIDQTFLFRWIYDWNPPSLLFPV